MFVVEVGLLKTGTGLVLMFRVKLGLMSGTGGRMNSGLQGMCSGLG